MKQFLNVINGDFVATGKTCENRAAADNRSAAAKGVSPVSFELGGKNAGIVFADAGFDKAVAGITRSAFENCGQVCVGTERAYGQRPIIDRFVGALKTKAETQKIGPLPQRGAASGPAKPVPRRPLDGLANFLQLNSLETR